MKQQPNNAGAQFRAAVAMAEVFEQCWQDPDFKAAFKNDPRPALANAGINVPVDVELRVVENEPGVLYLVLPSPGETPADTIDTDELSISPLPAGHFRLNYTI